MEFQEFPKMARLSRPCVVTEKIDGTNAQVHIVPWTSWVTLPPVLALHRELKLAMFAGSRTRWIVPTDDNFGFAKWACEHAEELFALGEGRHFGEWWGGGIQRGYGLAKDDKRFSLFNTNRWGPHRNMAKYPDDRPACCSVVPVLAVGEFRTADIEYCLTQLEVSGSQAAPGFMKPEGVVVYHVAAGMAFKKTIEKDAEPKGRRP